MKITAMLLLLGTLLNAASPIDEMLSTKNPSPVNKLQQCALYEDSFLTSASIFEDTQSCYDLKYSILSFKQMILSDCAIDPDYVTIILYLQTQYNNKCE